jgi:hypothetical protein
MTPSTRNIIVLALALVVAMILGSVIGDLQLPLPLTLQVVLLCSFVYWGSGPIILYFTLRRMSTPLHHEAVVPQPPTVPVGLARRCQELRSILMDAGFVENGWTKAIMSGEHTGGGEHTGVTGLFSHRESSDLAQVILLGPSANPETLSAEALEFKRDRIDGSSICTGTSTTSNARSFSPPWPPDNILRMGPRRHPLQVWKVHQLRVAADAEAMRNKSVDDVVAYQLENDRVGAERCVTSGYWQPSGLPNLLRPTARGALLMAWRWLPPSAQFNNFLASWEVRRLTKAEHTQNDTPDK